MRAKRRRDVHRPRMDAPTTDAPPPQRGASAPLSALPQEEDGEAWHVTPAAWLLVPCGLPLS